MSRLRSEVLEWLDSGRVVPGRETEVLRAAGLVPTPADWQAFLGQLALWLGTVALAASVIFFFAFNWDDLGRFAKFGLVQAAIVAGLLVCWRADLDGMVGKAVLLLLSLLVGALLALTGQVYQTGADTFELFAWWALLILPWVLIGRFSPLWLLWLALLNLAVLLYFALFSNGETLLWMLFALNGLALVAVEGARRLDCSWLRDSWTPRLVAMASAGAATALMLWTIMGGGDGFGLLAALAYFAWLAGLYAWYRRARPDLFMLAAGLLSLIVTVAAFLSRHMLEGGGGAGFLFIGLVVIGMAAGGAVWLKTVAGEQQA
ncbi:MAG TPA: DUF2157 domain-containing protein [Allosphingosinicella sp.]|nr:DUF2157 domain-containing protein [Allosphingosinicella sp.]